MAAPSSRKLPAAVVQPLRTLSSSELMRMRNAQGVSQRTLPHTQSAGGGQMQGQNDVIRAPQSLNAVELRGLSASASLEARQLPNMAMTESVMLNNPYQVAQQSPNRSPS